MDTRDEPVLTSLPDRDLVLFAGRWTPWVLGWRMALGAAAVFALLVAIAWLCVSSFAALVAMLANVVMAKALAALQGRIQRERGPNPYWSELQRRAGTSTTLFLVRHALPHGDKRVVWIDLGRSLLIATVHPFSRTEVETTIHEARLTDEEVSALTAAVLEVREPGDSNRRFEVRDGLPFDLTLKRDVAWLITGNLAVDGSARSGWRLAQLINATAGRLCGISSSYGAVDAKGNITLGAG